MNLKRTAIAMAVLAATGGTSVAANAATTVTLLDNATPHSPFPAAINAVNNGAFTAGNEFRVMSGGNASGFGEKNTVNGLQSWSFDGAGSLTGVAGTSIVPNATMQPPNPGVAPPNSGPGLFLNATFFGGAFGFLAPTVGSAAGIMHGVMTIAGVEGNNDGFTIHAPVMEAHWNNGIFTLGSQGGVGVTFNCSGGLAGGHCDAAHVIHANEDSAGFQGQEAQWEFDVAVQQTTPQVPIPAAVWLFGSGLVGLAGIARRRRTSA